MTLTPEDIEHQAFKEKFRGYDPEEVDRFLDRVADRLVELTREREDLLQRLEKTEREAHDAVEAERLLKRTLVDAQRTADDAIAEARDLAARTIADARRQAEEIVSDARRVAAEEKEQARLLGARVARAVEDIRTFRNEYHDRVVAVIADHLELFKQTGELPELPDRMLHLLEDVAPDGQDAGESAFDVDDVDVLTDDDAGEAAITPADVLGDSSNDL